MNTIINTKKILPRFFSMLIVIVYLSVVSFAQPTILYNKGAQIYFGDSSLLKLNGRFINDGQFGTTPVFENNGTVIIKNSGTPGSVFLINNSTMKGNGTYELEQDWTNDAVFLADTSTVTFSGNTQQFITSTNGTVTTFNNLFLTGTGIGVNRKKTLKLVDAKIGTSGTLVINDRELETDTNTIFVLNPLVTAVSNNTVSSPPGFVSSSFKTGGSGSLSRVTNSTSAYVFPTGSSVNTVRYRPVLLTPSASATNAYTARLGNNNALIDGFNTASLDTNTCTVNTLFYHEITHPVGSNNSDIDILYDQTADGNWDGIAKWNSITPNIWNNMGTVTTSAAIPFNDVLKVNWADFSNSPYVLSRQKPPMPLLACNPVCANSSGNVFSATGSGTSYMWSTPAGTTITSGQNTNTVTVDWGPTSGSLTVVTSSALGCVSSPASCMVNTSLGSVAAFSSVSPEQLSYKFKDLSTGNPNQWTWDFDDGTFSNAQNPTHIFTKCGLKKVCLTVGDGTCIDTVCSNIDIDLIFNIPNVFTPDGDGINDVFFVNNTTCVKDFHLEIFNRWGMTIYETSLAGGGWDGYTASGVPSADGTYYYILKTTTFTGKDEITKGFISLVRKN